MITMKRKRLQKHMTLFNLWVNSDILKKKTLIQYTLDLQCALTSSSSDMGIFRLAFTANAIETGSSRARVAYRIILMIKEAKQFAVSDRMSSDTAWICLLARLIHIYPWLSDCLPTDRHACGQ